MHLRRASLRWPARNQAFRLARIDRGFYKCNSCGKAYGYKEVKADHISPVVNIKDGFTTWDAYIKSLFVDVSGYQILCDSCHDTKTLIENHARNIYKKNAKELDKRNKLRQTLNKKVKK